ncbi:hypothetical protein JNJ66_00815 [Candidatus Saccharibacteria bacterium]|nr:hypothetical protein [Candidatus Saccharibacteria bacterium]
MKSTINKLRQTSWAIKFATSLISVVVLVAAGIVILLRAHEVQMQRMESLAAAKGLDYAKKQCIKARYEVDACDNLSAIASYTEYMGEPMWSVHVWPGEDVPGYRASMLVDFEGEKVNIKEYSDDAAE